MAIFDAMFELSDNQTVTTTTASTDILDLVVEDIELGAGEPLYLNVRVGTTAFSTGGDNDGTLTVALVYDTAAPVDGSSTVIYQTAALAEANLTAGAWIIRMALPVNVDEESIVGLYYTTANTLTAGTIDAWIDHGPQSSYDTQVSTSNI
jgi:hypothetical protein